MVFWILLAHIDALDGWMTLNSSKLSTMVFKASCFPVDICRDGSFPLGAVYGELYGWDIPSLALHGVTDNVMELSNEGMKGLV